MMKLKNQNGTHHSVFAYNKFQVQLSRVTECLVSNISDITYFRLSKPLTPRHGTHLRNTALEEYGRFELPLNVSFAGW